MVKRILPIVCAVAVTAMATSGLAMVRKAPATGSAAPTAAKPLTGIGVAMSLDCITVKSGGTVRVTLTMFNRTKTPVQYLEHGFPVRWQIEDASGAVVYDFLKGKMLPHFVIVRSLTGDVVYKQDLAMKDDSGTALKPGVYTIRGHVANNLGLEAEASVTVQ